MHTPTGGIVEIIFDDNYVIKGNYQQLPFSEFTEDKSMRNMALLLHSKPGSISIEDGRKAMEAISKWYMRHTLEYQHINNLKWID